MEKHSQKATKKLEWRTKLQRNKAIDIESNKKPREQSYAGETKFIECNRERETRVD